jgi:hypothetical protein
MLPIFATAPRFILSRTALHLAFLKHERLRLSALASSNGLHRAAGRDGDIILIKHGAGACGHDKFVTVLDQEPVCAFGAFPIVGHADGDETAMQPLALKGKLEIALRQRLFGGPCSVRLPITAVPQHDSAAAILTLGNRPFEVTIIERMIFDLDRKPLVTGVE